MQGRWDPCPGKTTCKENLFLWKWVYRPVYVYWRHITPLQTQVPSHLKWKIYKFVYGTVRKIPLKIFKITLKIFKTVFFLWCEMANNLKLGVRVRLNSHLPAYSKIFSLQTTFHWSLCILTSEIVCELLRINKKKQRSELKFTFNRNASSPSTCGQVSKTRYFTAVRH